MPPRADEKGLRVTIAGRSLYTPATASTPGDLDLRLAPVDLRLLARLVHLRHEHLVDRLSWPPPTDP